MKTTIHLDDDLHRVLKLRGSEPRGPSISKQINDAVHRAIAQDAEDAAEAMRRHRTETFVALEEAVDRLRRDGRL